MCLVEGVVASANSCSILLHCFFSLPISIFFFSKVNFELEDSSACRENVTQIIGF